MKVTQAYKLQGQNWKYLNFRIKLNNPLVLVFAGRNLLENEEIIEEIKNEFPYEHIVFGSTSGEIINNNVFDNSIVVTAIEFEKSNFEIKTANIFNFNKDAKKLGKSLYNSINKKKIKTFICDF